jgi:CPA2 family monovalent cation:H+ antiporter-2
LVTGLAFALGRAGLFLALLLPLGFVVLPRFLAWVADLRSREVFVLAVGAVALGTAYVASLFGLSLALGAFLAGVVVSESDLSHQVLGELLPVQDLFAGLFFVSAGMLIDPQALATDPVALLVIVALVVVAKGGLVVGMAALLGVPLRTALLVGAALAQSAEFSFLLARQGSELGIVTPPTFSLLLGGAAVSMVFAPSLLKGAGALSSWLDVRLPLSPLAALPAADEGSHAALRGHAVLCGHGQVGGVIAGVLRRRAFPLVVVDQDRQLVQRLRAQGVPALLGNAANPILLERARLEDARLLLVAIADPMATRQVVTLARRMNPRLDIVARTHSEAEWTYLNDGRVSEAVLGERELAIEMAAHALRRFGVSGPEVQLVVRGLRARAG